MIWGTTNLILFHACPGNSTVNAVNEKVNGGRSASLLCSERGGWVKHASLGRSVFEKQLLGKSCIPQ